VDLVELANCYQIVSPSDTRVDETDWGRLPRGWEFKAPNVRPALFYATAVPEITSGVGKSGTRRFGISEDAVLHGDSVALTPYADEAAIKFAPVLGN